MVACKPTTNNSENKILGRAGFLDDAISAVRRNDIIKLSIIYTVVVKAWYENRILSDWREFSMLSSRANT